jgi:hypothetical protein
MPAKELTISQKEDAARLKAVFEQHQASLRKAGKPYNQAAILGEDSPFGQSALSQYLNGRIPLNWPSLQYICTLVGAEPEVISPSIVQEERESHLAWHSAIANAGTKEPDISYRKKPDSWPFPDIDKALFLALRGSHAIAIQAAILGTATGLGISLSPDRKGKRAA